MMRVGVNYPWFDYGWDFGVAPSQWRGAKIEPRWSETVDEHLAYLRSLGITVVRWFVLADGLTYGSGQESPRPDPTLRQVWRFDPPPLSGAFLADFEALLSRFADANENVPAPIQLLPVLIDFRFCEVGSTPANRPDPANPERTIADPDWVKQGRADAITDPGKRSRFLDRVLDPLLGASAARADVIYAWELINEPEWVTNSWHPDGQANHPVTEASMRAFLDEGMARVRAAGLKPTIGFASIDTLRRSGITPDINQFHHYAVGAKTLEGHTFNGGCPTIVGEFATAPTDVWPELKAVGQTVLNRLTLAEAQGYPLAIPWSLLAADSHTLWSGSDVRLFTEARNGFARS